MLPSRSPTCSPSSGRDEWGLRRLDRAADGGAQTQDSKDAVGFGSGILLFRLRACEFCAAASRSTAHAPGSPHVVRVQFQFQPSATHPTWLFDREPRCALGARGLPLRSSLVFGPRPPASLQNSSMWAHTHKARGRVETRRAESSSVSGTSTTYISTVSHLRLVLFFFIKILKTYIQQFCILD